MASIAWFVIEQAGNPAPYYWKVPESFIVPAVYFSRPEIETGGETFLTYHEMYTWHIQVYDHSEQGAWQKAYDVVKRIRGARNLIPLRDEDGKIIEGEWVRINDPSMIGLDENMAQITIKWRSRQPYDDTLAYKPEVEVFKWFIKLKEAHRPDEDEVERILEEIEP